MRNACGALLLGVLLVWGYPLPPRIEPTPADPAPCGVTAARALVDWMDRAPCADPACRAARDWFCPGFAAWSVSAP